MNPKNTVLFLILNVKILITFNSTANACKCAPMESSCEASSNASAVFIGLVEDSKGTAEPRTYQIKVKRVLTGNVADKVKAHTGNPNNCGYPFASGKKYFIYAYSDSDNPNKRQVKEFQAILCHRIFPLDKAKADLEFFSNPTLEDERQPDLWNYRQRQKSGFFFAKRKTPSADVRRSDKS